MFRLIIVYIIIFFAQSGFSLNLNFRNDNKIKRTFYKDSKGFMSLFDLSEKMGAEINWDRDLGRIRMKRFGHVISFLTDSNFIFYKNKIKTFNNKPRIIDGEIFVPSDYIRVIYKELSMPGETWIIKNIPENNSTDSSKINKKDKIKKKSKKFNIIFVDPGHGGRDPGAVGYKQIKEADIVLAISKKLVKKLRRELPNIKIVLIRKSNRTISLSQRALIANKYLKKGYKGIFISVHANASLSRRRYGFETYYLSPIASNAEARSTAVIENGALEVDIKGKQHGLMNNILSKMLVEEYRRESMSLAGLIQKNLTKYIGRYTINRKVKKANFFVMRQVYMPSVLVEVGFLTNRKEALLLKNAFYQNKVSNGIALGIKKFIHLLNKKD